VTVDLTAQCGEAACCLSGWGSKGLPRLDTTRIDSPRGERFEAGRKEYGCRNSA